MGSAAVPRPMAEAVSHGHRPGLCLWHVRGQWDPSSAECAVGGRVEGVHTAGAEASASRGRCPPRCWVDTPPPQGLCPH